MVTVISGAGGGIGAATAHALARTDRVGDAIDACEQAMELGTDAEVAALLRSLRERQPRRLPTETAA